MAVGQNRVDLLLKLVRGNGCKMDDATAGRVLLPNGFTKAGVFEIKKILDRAGMVDTSKTGMFALTKAACKR